MDEHNRTINVQEKNMSDVQGGAPSAPASAAPVESSAPETSIDTSVDSESDYSGMEDGLGGEDSIDTALEAGEITKQEAKALKKKLKLKVDGQEIEEEVSWDDEEGLKKHLQKSKAFDKRAKEHATYKAQVEQMIQMLQQDPEGFLEKMGLNVDDMAEKRLSRKIEELKKTPEEIEAEKMRKRLEELEKKEKEANERAQKAELEKLKNEQATKIETDISEALESSKSILPKKNPAVIQRIAQAMLFAYNNGFKDVSAKDVIPYVEKQFKSEYASILGSSSDDVLEALASKERLSSYRKAQVKAKAPSVQKPKIQDTGKVTKKEQPAPEPFQSKNWMKINPNK